MVYSSGSDQEAREDFLMAMSLSRTKKQHSDSGKSARGRFSRIRPSRKKRARWKAAFALFAVLIAYGSYSAGTFMGSSASGKIVGGQNGISEALGYDSCEPPTGAEVEEQWGPSPFAYVGTYLGGVTAREVPCLIPERSFYVEAHNEHEHKERGMDFLPIWDGRQAPCSGLPNTFSEAPAESYAKVKSQAAAEVDAAVGAAESRGFSTHPGSIFYYDLEGFGGVNTAEHPHCVEAAREFINVWVKRLNELYATPAGVYGSSSSSNLKEYYTSMHKPNDVWFAEYGSGKSVYAVPESVLPIEDSKSRRFHQYTKNEIIFPSGDETKIDRDCAYGQVAGFGGSKAEPACHA